MFYNFEALPRGYKTFFIFNSTEHEIYPAHNVKNSIVGI